MPGLPSVWLLPVWLANVRGGARVRRLRQTPERDHKPFEAGNSGEAGPWGSKGPASRPGQPVFVRGKNGSRPWSEVCGDGLVPVGSLTKQ